MNFCKNFQKINSSIYEDIASKATTVYLRVDTDSSDAQMHPAPMCDFNNLPHTIRNGSRVANVSYQSENKSLKWGFWFIVSWNFHRIISNIKINYLIKIRYLVLLFYQLGFKKLTICDFLRKYGNNRWIISLK